jgi:hypothetical protein
MKSFGVTDRGDYGGGGDRAYAFELHQPLRGLILPRQLHDLPLVSCNTFIHFLHARL